MTGSSGVRNANPEQGSLQVTDLICTADDLTKHNTSSLWDKHFEY
jgi:hypothetical protein